MDIITKQLNDSIPELLEKGLNAQDIYLRTPLMLAVMTNDIKRVQQLLKLGADVSIVDHLGQNILHCAAARDNLEILNIILNTNLDINLKTTGGFKNTALCCATAKGLPVAVPVVQTLLEHGADPNIQDKKKMTALHWVVAFQEELEALKILLKFGANVNNRNNQGVTVLMSAAIKGILECVHILVLAGAEINVPAKDGFTELMCAAYYGHEEIAKYLLANGADKNAITKKGETALSIAKKKNFNTIVAVLESN